jgi:hypothetical protein
LPADWNGTVLLYSHGYTPPGVPNAARNTPDDTTKSLLLKQGYALTGSSYATTGWAVTEAVPDQLATLDTFTARFVRAGQTIAWGTSYDGLVQPGRHRRRRLDEPYELLHRPLAKPQLNIHTTGGALIPVQSESACRRAATAAGSTALLRQGYVDNAGHCTFSPGEQIAALHTLEDRITTGHWRGSDPVVLNSRVTEADPSSSARYVRYLPAPYPRSYDRAHPSDGHRT